MNVEQLLDAIKASPEGIEFTQVMDTIAEYYHYSPTEFKNGPNVINAAGTNEGSCKIFAFAQLQQLNVNETLNCFGQYYRNDVLQNPKGNDHSNIRSFMVTGWDGIHFDNSALHIK